MCSSVGQTEHYRYKPQSVVLKKLFKLFSLSYLLRAQHATSTDCFHLIPWDMI